MLYLVPTPIGNLDDITLRALRVLQDVDLIACEDTRRTGVLLSHFDIDNRTISYHDHNERQRAPQLIKQLKAGHDIALVSDAGAPGISDPGFYLVREAVNNQIEVQALPGATAFVPALTASALPSDRFVFEGFLPQKKGRMKRLKEARNELRTLVYYESPYRLLKALRQMADVFGENRQAVVARELSKTYEEYQRGTLTELIDEYESRKNIKGEVVILVAGAEQTA